MRWLVPAGEYLLGLKLQSDLDALDEQYLMLKKHVFAVYCAPAQVLPMYWRNLDVCEKLPFEQSAKVPDSHAIWTITIRITCVA